MKASLLAAAILAVAATGASAQVTTQFRGIKVEGNVGYDKFQSQGTNNEKFGYGGSVGFDGTINDKFLVGAEGSYWRANKFTQNVSLVPDGVVAHKSFEEYGVAARGGFVLSPALVVFGKGGYVINEQRRAFLDTAGGSSFYNHGRTSGYQVGGGVEFSPTQFDGLPVPVYVSAQYVYSNYTDHTSRQRAMLGVGVRFR